MKDSLYNKYLKDKYSLSALIKFIYQLPKAAAATRVSKIHEFWNSVTKLVNVPGNRLYRLLRLL